MKKSQTVCEENLFLYGLDKCNDYKFSLLHYLHLEYHKQYLWMLDPNFGVGGLSGVLLPKTQAIFGEEGNETTWFVETEVIFI